MRRCDWRLRCSDQLTVLGCSCRALGRRSINQTKLRWEAAAARAAEANCLPPREIRTGMSFAAGLPLARAGHEIDPQVPGVRAHSANVHSQKAFPHVERYRC